MKIVEKSKVDKADHIVIGGDLLDRGFVVKGLVTTYMQDQKESATVTPSSNVEDFMDIKGITFLL